jgi:ribonuclease HI
MVIDDVIILERQLLEPETRCSAHRLDELLDSDFQEIGASGRLWTRAEIISTLVTEPDSQHIECFSFVGRQIEPGLVHLTYETDRAGRHALRSSLWRQSDGGWKLLFHQGTLVSSTEAQVRHH